MNLFYRLFLTLNSTFLIISVYLIKEEYCISFLTDFPKYISYVIYILFPFFLTGISILVTRFLSDDNMECDAKDIEQANNAYLPSYLGYFFVALSVPFNDTLIFIYAILFLFTFFSQTLYFNPLFLLWGYKFYYITKDNNIKIFLISKKIIRVSKNLNFQKLKRINDFTFIDIGGKNESVNS